MRIQLSQEALQDIERSIDFYEQIKPGLGSYIRDCLTSDIGSLLLYGGIHAMENGWFYTFANRFPYVIWYGIENDVAIVYAVIDARNEPSKSEGLLRNRRDPK